ncbi:Alcohol dehydrogenase zinc-binding domain protein [Kribbella flavida DSM 17836]|uniref:Alcohol dehydrogenase zinc-binding domain protein n=1 Tax=Kribbella flavida (strain DSM 17836 / JCM 10339 / NBRC 14399) TaxID=479435 RepID=D2PWM8_KRIFD|nr:medium chain dehydrogenase/reductase family protein [Kribbella flavida]ADB33497.1 Alcohol dehydrogenase zinc-binding domain protein [Kribbella flavida DSM 17836]
MYQRQNHGTEQLTQVVLPGKVEPDGLHLTRGAIPVPGSGEVLVAMEATGISFAEQQMRRGRYYDQPPFPFVPGYDLVGTVVSAGAGVEPALLGRRVAVLTKIGGWASHLVVGAAKVVEVPDGISAVDAETVVVNGVTAWQMLHGKAKIRAGQTILVHGANGGVGSTLVQLARAAGVHVIGTASARHHAVLRALGVEPVDYRSEDVPSRVRELAPGGVDAVFDHVGGRSVVDSWGLLAKGGTLVSYGTASTKEDSGSKQLPVLKILARVLLWNALPNGRHAYFYNLWAGVKHEAAYYARLREDLTSVFGVMRSGDLTAQVAGVLPLTRVADALRLAESGTVTGKVVLIP